MDELIETLQRRREACLASAEQIVEAAAQAGRDLNATEAEALQATRQEVRALDERIAELREQSAREEVAAAANRRLAAGQGARTRPRGGTYNPQAAREGISFLRDVWASEFRGDVGARQRLEAHQREALDVYVEYRDVGTGAFAGIVVPQYLTELVAPLARAGRPVADIATSHPLPPEGMTVNISRITTGASVASQVTENTNVSETDMDDTLVSVPVVTIAGMQDVSRQAIERGAGVDEIVIADLARAYATELDNQIINGTGAAGQHRGIRSTAGIVTVTYTDATPTAAELYPKLFDLIQQIQSAVFMGVTHFVMHPRRWWWLASEVGTSFPFLQLASAPQGAGGVVLGTGGYGEGLSGVLATVGVVLDANVPTNLGAGANEDVILGVTAPELHLWEDPGAPLLIRAEQPLSNQLSVRFVLYGYSAFTAGRYPAAHGVIAGTGLATPTF